MSQKATNTQEHKIARIYFENTGNFAIFALMNEKHQ